MQRGISFGRFLSAFLGSSLFILCPVYILHVSTLGQLSVHSQCGAQGMGSL